VGFIVQLGPSPNAKLEPWFWTKANTKLTLEPQPPPTHQHKLFFQKGLSLGYENSCVKLLRKKKLEIPKNKFFSCKFNNLTFSSFCFHTDLKCVCLDRKYEWTDNLVRILLFRFYIMGMILVEWKYLNNQILVNQGLLNQIAHK
jgi:hypothetical protein